MTGYLLSIQELRQGPESASLWREALEKLDDCRRAKADRLGRGGDGFAAGETVSRQMAQAVGAGLLLQLGAQGGFPGGREARAGAEPGDRICLERLTVPEALERLGEPVPVAYVTGRQGKPDFPEGMGHFNLSHSEELVCAVFDEAPVGVDIQWMRPLRNMRLAERFFSGRERALLEECREEDARTRLFYDFWVKKESWAKLTGEGIASAVTRDIGELSLAARWQECEMPEGYRGAVCRYQKDQKNLPGA